MLRMLLQQNKLARKAVHLCGGIYKSPEKSLIEGKMIMFVVSLLNAKYTQTLTLFFTSPRVGGFPFLAASAIGSSLDVFAESSLKLMTGITVSVPGTLWYCSDELSLAIRTRGREELR